MTAQDQHIITREMLISTLNDVMTERDAAKKSALEWHNDWQTLDRQRVALLTDRAKLEKELATEKAIHSREMTIANSEIEQMKRTNDSYLGEIQRLRDTLQDQVDRSKGLRPSDAELRIKELQQMVQSLQTNLITVQRQRDDFERQLEKKSAFDGFVALQKKLLDMTDERDSLKQKQCDCLPGLMERKKAADAKVQSLDIENAELKEDVKRLEAQLPEGMKDCTFVFERCENGHGRLVANNWVTHLCPWCIHTKLRTLFEMNMHSKEMLQSNPPKNIVAYRGEQILRGVP